MSEKKNTAGDSRAGDDERVIERSLRDALSRELEISPASIGAVLALLQEGATVPFIARYRKERTGGLDEERIRAVQDSYHRWMAIETRRASILSSLRRQGLLTEDLEHALLDAREMQALEDLYLPYRPRRRTRADVAREAGLEPLARALLADCATPVDSDASLRGAIDIIAAECALDAVLRSRLRDLFHRQAVLESRRKASNSRPAPEDAATYRDFFDWREPARRCPSHRVLALFRGEEAGVLRVQVRPPEAAAIRLVEEFLHEKSPCNDRRRRALWNRIAEDAYRRLLAPALEKELRSELRAQAEEAAAEVFAANLRDLLMAPPLGPQPVLALDPGFRSGSKVVALDRTGAVTAWKTIYPLPPQERIREAAEILRGLSREHHIRAIAVGSGTGGREVEAFVRSLALTDQSGTEILVVRVNEAGASVYSASAAARAEFPDLDVTIRGAISIGRRLQDPLSELVKIDPAAVGVGQYQHDIGGKRLERALSRTVESCVNAVGVEINTAGVALLARVSGLSPAQAESIVSYRDRFGPFITRESVKGVPGIGPRTAEQALGFIRCLQSDNPLDNTGVHPEQYPLVEAIARDNGCATADLCGNGALLDRIEPGRYVSERAGLPTVEDILRELRSPGRDPRPSFEPVFFREDMRSIDDLAEGVVLPGTVTNVTDFGAFVDIGVGRDGLIHISRLADRFVRDPREIVRVGQAVEVRVRAVDRERRRIDLEVAGNSNS